METVTMFLAILGGLIVRDVETKKWRTARYTESSRCGPSGLNARVAAAALLNERFDYPVLCLGLESHDDQPAVSDVIADELISHGVSEARVRRISLPRGSTTASELGALSALAQESDQTLRFQIITNRYHVPRVGMFLNLRRDFRMLNVLGTSVLSAEEVLLEEGEEEWKQTITLAYSSPGMMTRMENETRGISAEVLCKYF